MSPTLRLALSQLKSMPEKELAALERAIQRRRAELDQEGAEAEAREVLCPADDSNP